MHGTSQVGVQGMEHALCFGDIRVQGTQLSMAQDWVGPGCVVVDDGGKVANGNGERFDGRGGELQ